MTMKHILMLCLAAWLGTASLTAQEVVADTVATGMEEGVLTHDIKAVVTDKDGQPVVGALVTLRDYEDKPRLFKKYEEYGISAITDVDGKFFLEDVPVTAKYIVVESVGMGTEVREINKPLSVDTKRKKLTFVVQAGVSMSRYTVNGGSFKTGYEVGVGLEVRTSKHWAFRPMIQLAQRGTVYEQNQDGMSYRETWNPNFLDLSLYFVNRQKLAHKTNLVFSFGPVIAYGFSGKVKTDYNGQQEEMDVFDNKVFYDGYDYYSLLHPLSFGVAYSLGVEYKQLTVGVWGKNMAIGNDYNGFDSPEHCWALTFGAIYRF